MQVDVLERSAPPRGTVERWLWDYITTTDAAHKLDPPSAPDVWETQPPVRVVRRPGRPSSWRMVDKAAKRVKRGAVQHARRRRQLFHTFLHHELQAAELMGWAILAFPESPQRFRRGLLALCLDELRHLRMYQTYLSAHGTRFGALPLRDWFWTRVPRVTKPEEFLAVMGIGLEGGNLDHAERFASWFRDVGDDEAASILATVCAEEVRHVRFAARWFRRFTGGLDFEAWRARLPTPLSPTMLRGKPLNRRDRGRSGLGMEFLDRLEAW